jgi:hypothetical protein
VHGEKSSYHCPTPKKNSGAGGQESGQPDRDSSEDTERDCLEVGSDPYRDDS